MIPWIYLLVKTHCFYIFFCFFYFNGFSSIEYVNDCVFPYIMCWMILLTNIYTSCFVYSKQFKNIYRIHTIHIYIYIFQFNVTFFSIYLCWLFAGKADDIKWQNKKKRISHIIHWKCMLYACRNEKKWMYRMRGKRFSACLNRWIDRWHSKWMKWYNGAWLLLYFPSFYSNFQVLFFFFFFVAGCFSVGKFIFYVHNAALYTQCIWIFILFIHFFFVSIHKYILNHH